MLTPAAGKSSRIERARRLGDGEGHLAMLALDQRESLRTMIGLATGDEQVPDQRLRDFKTAAVQILGATVSAVLIDPQFGADAIAAVPTGTRLIVSADNLIQERGGLVTGSEINRTVTREYVEAVGADALKLLIVWRDDNSAKRDDLAGEFVELCSSLGVTSLVEGVVTPRTDEGWASPAEKHDAVLAAATELARSHPDIYKAEVPGYTPGDLSAVRENSRAMTSIVDGPWVVLSSGVTASDFADVVAAACAEGAWGFLAGRAIWRDVVGDDDLVGALKSRSIPCIERYKAAMMGAMNNRSK